MASTESRDAHVYSSVTQNTRLTTLEQRKALYAKSLADRTAFWSEIAQSEFYWQTPFTKTLSFNYDVKAGPISQKWFEGGVTNMCYNCLDRHLTSHKDQVAFYWEGNDVGDTGVMTYGQLFTEVCKLATVLRTQYGVKKGTTVAIYLPMIFLGPIAMLACARLGAICNVVFGGFSANALASRMKDAKSALLITAEGTFRGSKPIRLKHIADEAMAECKAAGLDVHSIVFERHGRDGVPMQAGRDAWYQDLIENAVADPFLEWMDAEDPLFMLYTSGSTGNPKGLVHTTGGYMVYAATTFKYVFDFKPDSDVYFSTADIGWITGHSYLTFGPLLNRATSILFEGVPTHPTASRWWDIVDKFKVTIFYTAPTAIRSLIKEGDQWLAKSSRHSLRILGSVGEPINAAAWEWYHKVVGRDKCDIVDTWWQTETGGIMITPLPGCTPLKPGSATLPFFGIEPIVIDHEGKALTGPSEGYLVLQHPWPGQARTVYGDHQRYEETYFSQYPGYYFTGDGCRRDADGYYWITGRVDDVLNVSGHRIGTGEVENAINHHPGVVESAVVSMPHDIKGEGIYAYVTFQEGIEVTKELLNAVRNTVRASIGPIATPDVIQPAPHLPKTRSGKIMRRILRKIAAGIFTDFGDTSTLADPTVVQVLIDLHNKWSK
jgi:acetyl-CoA synthetase